MSTAMCLIVAPAIFAESELSLYLGLQEAFDSNAEVIDIDGSRYDIDVEWNGRSFEFPPYFGARYTNWLNEKWGIGAEFTHSKVYASEGTLDRTNYDILQFTDGINVFTLNALRRFKNQSRFTPYMGVGVGFNMPHVEIQGPLQTRDDWEYNYQFGGLSATTFGGVSYEINDRWDVFSEFKLDHNQLDVDNRDTGNFQTDITTQALNFGVSLSF